MINLVLLLTEVLSINDFEYKDALSKIVKGIYSISTGGVTQKNISRQTNSLTSSSEHRRGYSYRSVQRFFALDINWSMLYLACINYFFINQPAKTYLLAIDEVVEKKSGKSTHGVGRFFSSIFGKPIRSVCFHVLSVIGVDSRKSFVLAHESREAQTNKSDKLDKKNKSKGVKGLKKSTKKAKRKVGRPKGSKNKTTVKEHTDLSKSFERLLQLGLTLLASIGIIPSYIVADGAYASKTYVLISRELGIELISKIRNNSVLYLPANPDANNTKGKKKRGRKKSMERRLNMIN